MRLGCDVRSRGRIVYVREADGPVRVGMIRWFGSIGLPPFQSFNLVVYCGLFPPLCTKAKKRSEV